MIEVYNRTEHGKDRLVATFETYHEFFRGLREENVKAFGYTEVERTTASRLFGDRNNIDADEWAHTRNCYIAIEDGNLVTPDRLVGLFRDWWKDRPRWRWNRHGWSPGAYGQYRGVKTTNERRQIEATKGEENAPKIRAARNFRNLPNAWDDFMSHNDKSWKTQSKRRHQYKD